MIVETREVLAGAYRGGVARTLSHAVVVDATGIAVEVLCNRVNVDNLADRYASDPHAPVSCTACRRAVQRRLQSGDK